MAFKAQTAAQTKARDLGLALARIAENEGMPAAIGVDRLRAANPQLTPAAVGQMIRKERDLVEVMPGERGPALSRRFE